ncbi:hypothetical protein MJH12_17910, partial [bacterium]|nr:hypothetical protein [bacterium]
MISYCRFITVFLLLLCSTNYSVSAEQCSNGGDATAKFNYAAVLSDANGNTLTGFQSIALRVSLFDSLVQGIELYSQSITNVD